MRPSASCRCPSPPIASPPLRLRLPSPRRLRLALLLALASSLPPAAAVPPLHPSRAPLRTLRLPSASAAPLLARVPHDDAVLEALLASAHADALAAGEASYDDAMAAICSRRLAARPAYWAQPWPCALALAACVADRPALVRGRAALELGAGLGLVAVGAARAGAARVVGTDREAAALPFISRNAKENGVPPGVLVTALLDWSSPDPMASLQRSLSLPAPPTFDVVLCSDCLYDETAPPLLASLLHAAVAPGGACLFTDNADRPYADARRAALLSLLCDQGDFEMEERSRTAVEIETLQGNRFDIELCIVRRTGTNRTQL
ncbi:hypothetical protein AB1Y20_004412 [Prymnesium parvum]|uniref:Calmodulin-lysine N-methyltransferase n=1 Tax=Prymnesium parvum TaxID=97485 RepID=A0AB34IWF8_PRYPA